MNDANRWWVGTGSTPREAVRDLVPDTSVDHVAWVEGVRALPDDPDPPRNISGRSYDIGIIYESRPPKQWNAHVCRSDQRWRAVFKGSKRL